MSTPEPKRPSVKIVGAGIGGLTLGILLERAGVDYEIFERSAAVNPIGSAISLSASVMPMFEQLGLLPKLQAISKTIGALKIYSESHDYLGSVDYQDTVPRFHYPRVNMARPMLYEMLLEEIPKHKIHYGKKLLSHQETGQGVILRFSDNSEVEGNILVGADGANSAVRQHMYKKLERTDELPASDKLPLKYSSVALVGQTTPLDPEKYPILQGELNHPDVVISDEKPFMVACFPTPQNTIAWMMVEFLDKESSKLHDNFRTSEWGPEAAEAMTKDEALCRLCIPGANNATMGELIELTPKELMSKVMLEEKLFKTWSYGRTVLIGDACHKMTPAAGQGAVNAIIDAMILANYIESLQTNDLKTMEKAFKAYKNERFDRTKTAVGGSAGMMLMSGKGFLSNIVRKCTLDPPRWLNNIMAGVTEGYRPQVAFLPPVQDNGTVKTPYQPSLNLATSTRTATMEGAAV